MNDFSRPEEVLTDRYFKRLGKRVGRAIGDFGLIEEDNSRILVAVSGGKDSLCLIDFLSEKRRRSPVKFELVAFHVAMAGYPIEKIRAFVESRGIEFFVDNDALKSVDLANKRNRCFLCSWNRRKSIFLNAKRHNCRYVAFGHNMDDVAQTALLNMCFQASVSAMSPRQEMFGGEITIIRPLVYLRDYELSALADKFSYPVVKKCDYEKDNKRDIMKSFIHNLERENPKISVAKNIFLALNNINYDYLPSYVNADKKGEKDG